MSDDKYTEIVTFDWQGRTVEVRYAPDYFDFYRDTYGHPLAHIEVTEKDRQPLPITETGYKSHFTNSELIAEFGGPLGFVRAWLDDEAQLAEWKRHIATTRQLSLF